MHFVKHNSSSYFLWVGVKGKAVRRLKWWTRVVILFVCAKLFLAAANLTLAFAFKHDKKFTGIVTVRTVQLKLEE